MQIKNRLDRFFYDICMKREAFMKPVSSCSETKKPALYERAGFSGGITLWEQRVDVLIRPDDWCNNRDILDSRANAVAQSLAKAVGHYLLIPYLPSIPKWQNYRRNSVGWNCWASWPV